MLSAVSVVISSPSVVEFDDVISLVKSKPEVVMSLPEVKRLEPEVEFTVVGMIVEASRSQTVKRSILKQNSKANICLINLFQFILELELMSYLIQILIFTNLDII